MTINPWKKENDSGSQDLPTKEIFEFLAGDDVLLDRELFLFDIQASIAHVNGLFRIDILNDDERSQLISSLENLANEFKRGEFVLDARYEDGHSAIELYLTEKLGTIGGKVHTGRSRNDQVSVATRLYMQAQLTQLKEVASSIANALLNKAQEFSDMPIPGYTHLQRAKHSLIISN